MGVPAAIPATLPCPVRFSRRSPCWSGFRRASAAGEDVTVADFGVGDAEDVEQVERRQPGGEALQFLVVEQEGVEGAASGASVIRGGWP